MLLIISVPYNNFITYVYIRLVCLVVVVLGSSSKFVAAGSFACRDPKSYMCPGTTIQFHLLKPRRSSTRKVCVPL